MLYSRNIKPFHRAIETHVEVFKNKKYSENASQLSRPRSHYAQYLKTAFENATFTGHFEFVFEEYPDREITLLL